MRICIASPDIVGPINNGGVGTACTALAQFLAAEGHEVTLFYTSSFFERGDREFWAAAYARQGIGMMFLDGSGLPAVHRTPSVYDEDNLARSYHVYQQLKDTSFDVIHFVDYIGLGYFTALARSQGLALARTALTVTAHSPTLWSRLSNLRTVDDITYMIRDRMEQRLIALCDRVVSPSHYMLRWLQENGFTLPARQHVIPNLMPRRLAQAGPAPEDPAAAAIGEIVFFGRIEPRKGLLVFCDAIDRIRDRLPPNIRITFLGKTGSDYPPASIEARAARWGREVQVLDGLDTFQANDYLRAPGRLAVLAALSDNSPYTVLECLSNRIPFIASDVGGVAELIAPESQDRVLFQPTPAGLAERLEAALAMPPGGFGPASSAVREEETEEAFRRLHAEIAAGLSRPPRPPAARSATVSVLVLHYERPAGLAQALEGLAAQTRPPDEIIVVDNGSRTPAAVAFLAELEAEGRPGLRILRMGENAYEPAARNAGAYAATGRWLLFMDDDNVPKPEEVETFLRAAEAGGADLLTCFNDHFIGDTPPASEDKAVKRFVVMGDFGPLGLIVNGYGDLNCFVRRDVFLEIGGFVVDGRFNHAEDWRFFAKAWSRGLKLDVVPEALIWYRTGEGSWGGSWRKRDRAGALMRAAETYLSVAPPALRPFLLLSQGLFWKALEAENGRRAQGAELTTLRRQAAQLTERSALLELENELLRQRLVQVGGFVEHLSERHLPDDPEVERGVAFVRRLGRKYAG
ncbi:glycosyltransferase [Roseomonas populi]|uniref:Glycosyltransferase n=1 Tax=Roseomonas populi TaxID=3121582 RepID=A0ABT1X8G0_9PROT|nr:glycosyltransferase [Roseomonas pecuniae]MCR0983673.1 glycosyltransferase [Roseomonas pecuniae]